MIECLVNNKSERISEKEVVAKLRRYPDTCLEQPKKVTKREDKMCLVEIKIAEPLLRNVTVCANWLCLAGFVKQKLVTLE
jgi:hypothetical protein